MYVIESVITIFSAGFPDVSLVGHTGPVSRGSFVGSTIGGVSTERMKGSEDGEMEVMTDRIHSDDEMSSVCRTVNEHRWGMQ